MSTSRDNCEQPLVGIIMGSQSDWATMEHAANTLRDLGVAFENGSASCRERGLIWQLADS